MPTRMDIQQTIFQGKNLYQDEIRRSFLKNAASISGRDTILYATGWTSPRKYDGIPQGVLSLATEDVQGFMAAINGLKGNALDLIIHSPGGSLEAVDQLVQYLRSKYPNDIRAIVPHNAMSAACMLACACNEIVMGRQSAIGPIDPQLSWLSPNGPVSAPAQALLDELDEARNDIANKPQSAPIWATRLREYPPGIFEICKTTIELSKTKVAEWLGKYMFKGEQNAKATEIADWLASAKEHKTHGRPIGYDLCASNGLNVSRLEDNQSFQDAILSVFHATAVTFEVTQCVKIIENHEGRGHYVSYQSPRK